MEYKEFEKHHPATRVLPEELAKDWFLFENRLRYFTYEIIKPVLAQQKKLRGKIGTLLSKIDGQNLKTAMYEGELSRFKFDLRNIEKVMNDITQMENNLRELHLEVNSKNLEHSKRITNLSDREKVFEHTLRGFDNDVKVVKTELKSVENLVIATKEASASIFARAVGDFEARHQLVMEQLKKNSEKVNDAVAHLDKTKDQLRKYD